MSAQQAIDFSQFDSMFKDMVPVSSSEPAKETVKEESPGIEFVEVKKEENEVLNSAQSKLSQIESELNQLFVERNDVIKLLLLGLVTGSNSVLLGPPGCGKSMMVYELTGRIKDANYFQWMMNKTSDPSEILGPFSVKEMENDRFVRVTKGKIPESNICFVDEIFKSNAPCLNALLTLMNEKIFYNDGKPVPVPLISLIGASNEGPEDETLDALYDRFIFRYVVDYVHDVSNKKRMHNNYLDNRSGILGLTPKTTITLQEIKAAQDASLSVNVSKDIINKFIRLINDLEKNGIHVSDRRQNECFKVMQGSAILRGTDKVGLDDFKPLTYVLWEKEDQIPFIESTILKLINPFDDALKDLKTKFEEIKNDIDSVTDSSLKSKKAIESKGAVEKIISKINKLVNEAGRNGKDATELLEFKQNLVSYNEELVNQALGGNFLGNN